MHMFNNQTDRPTRAQMLLAENSAELNSVSSRNRSAMLVTSFPKERGKKKQKKCKLSSLSLSLSLQPLDGETTSVEILQARGMTRAIAIAELWPRGRYKEHGFGIRRMSVVQISPGEKAAPGGPRVMQIALPRSRIADDPLFLFLLSGGHCDFCSLSNVMRTRFLSGSREARLRFAFFLIFVLPSGTVADSSFDVQSLNKIVEIERGSISRWATKSLRNDLAMQTMNASDLVGDCEQIGKNSRGFRCFLTAGGLRIRFLVESRAGECIRYFWVDFHAWN